MPSNYTNPKSTQGTLARGTNVYGMSNAAPGAGRPADPVAPQLNTISTVPRMDQLNLAGAIERRLRGNLAPKSTAVPQARP